MCGTLSCYLSHIVSFLVHAKHILSSVSDAEHHDGANTDCAGGAEGDPASSWQYAAVTAAQGE